MTDTRPERTKVFVSYSHQDSDWLMRLRVHLKPFERRYGLNVWADTDIKPGSQWRDEIKHGLQTAKVAVLLVSADFIASDFVASNELPRLLHAAEEEGTLILPVILSPSMFFRMDELNRFQTVNDPSMPMVDLDRGKQEAVLVKLTEEIERAFGFAATERIENKMPLAVQPKPGMQVAQPRSNDTSDQTEESVLSKTDVSSITSAPTSQNQRPLVTSYIGHPSSKIAIGLLFLLTAGLALAVMLSGQFRKPQLVEPRRGASRITPATPETLDGHNGIVWSVAFSPVQELAVSGGDDKTIRLWKTLPWGKFKALLKHEGPVYSVGFSPDGKLLASASGDKKLLLWNGENGNFIRTIQSGPKPVLFTAFSPDKSSGNILVSVTGIRVFEGGEEIMLWYERDDWKGKTLPLKDVTAKIYSVAFSPDGNTLAAGGYGKNIYLWDPTTGTRRRELSIDQSAGGFVSRLAFSADGKYLAAGSHDGSIKLWQTGNWDQSPTDLPKAHDKSIIALAFSPDNTTLISASHDDTIRAWNITSRTSDLILISNKIRSVAFSPDGFFVLAGGDDQKLHVWIMRNGKVWTSSNERTSSSDNTIQPQIAISHFFSASAAFGRYFPVSTLPGGANGSRRQ